MSLRNTFVQLGGAVFLTALALAGTLAEALAGEIRVPAGGDALRMSLLRAQDGDVLRLESGQHKGPVIIDRKLTIIGEPGASVDGLGNGSVITIASSGVEIRGMTITGSGRDNFHRDSGVFANEQATGAIIRDNVLTGNLHGVYLSGSKDALVEGNQIVGLKDGLINETGNGVSVWNAPGAKVISNDISFGRDGIYTNASRHNIFSNNRFHDVRFAIHYMYTNDSQIRGNISTGNTIGFAIMYSARLVIADNVSDGDRDYGLLLNSTDRSSVTGNTVTGHMSAPSRWALSGRHDNGADGAGVPSSEVASVLPGDMKPTPEKCVFIYNANSNRLADNRFENCGVGVHFTAGSEKNTISGNAFIANKTQVRYVGTRYLDWSSAGRGNYWSDNPAFDLDGDGIADRAYRPNGLLDQILWRAPQAKLLLASPAVSVLRIAQERFPALLPGGVIDSRPLMKPPTGKGDRP